MSIAPVNFYASFSLVPVFQWEPVEPAPEPTADPQPVAAAGSSVDSVQELTSDTDKPDSPEMQLVFKGFEWVFTPGIATFPRPDWMDGATAGCTQEADSSIQDDERRKEMEEAERHRRAALAHPNPNAASSQDVGAAATDTSDAD